MTKQTDKRPPKLAAAFALIDAQPGGWASALTWPRQYVARAARKARAKGVTAEALTAAIEWKLRQRQRALVRDEAARAPERERAKQTREARAVPMRVCVTREAFNALVVLARKRGVTAVVMAELLIAELADG
jgi:hypothetical protein